MSTLKDIAEAKTTVYIKPKEGFLLSFSRDLITFLFIGLGVYISQDSKFWTFITGTMFIMFIAGKVTSVLKSNSTTFKDSKAAIEYLEKQDAI